MRRMNHAPGLGVEDRFIAAVRRMLARPDYLIPLAAAERQFRDHYYGLNSAALLEDLFFDALGNFLRQTEPTTRWDRPGTGQKGWDYAFDGLQISHKVSQGMNEIAALWDATKQGVDRWSFDDPITYVLGRNSPSTGIVVEANGQAARCRALGEWDRTTSLAGKAVLVVVWSSDSEDAQILEYVDVEPAATPAEAISFRRVWERVAQHVAAGGAANELDVLVTTARPTAAVRRAFSCNGGLARISVPQRGGVYLFRSDMLQNLEVTTNNRAILIPKSTIPGLIEAARRRNLFAPLPLWYSVHAERRPPDMYSSQRAEYDAHFSARGGWDSSGQ